MDLERHSPSYLAAGEPWQRGKGAIGKDLKWRSVLCGCMHKGYMSLSRSLTCPLSLLVSLQGNTPPVVVNTDTLDGSPYVRIRFDLLFMAWL